MKASIIVLAGAIGLMGCTPMAQHRLGDGRNEGSPLTYSGKSEAPPPADKQVKPNDDPYVRDLPRDARTALAEVGIKDIAFLVAIDRQGETRLLKPDNVEYKRNKLPVKKVVLRKPRSITIIPFEGSDCVLLIDDSPQTGKWVPGHTEGGALMLGYCDTYKGDESVWN